MGTKSNNSRGGVRYETSFLQEVDKVRKVFGWSQHKMLQELAKMGLKYIKNKSEEVGGIENLTFKFMKEDLTFSS